VVRVSGAAPGSMCGVTDRFPDPLRQQILDFPEVHMAVHRITVELRDGTAVSGVLVDWEGVLIPVEGDDRAPFAMADVVAAYDASSVG